MTIAIVDDGVDAPYEDIPNGAYGQGWVFDPNWGSPYESSDGHGTTVASAAIARVTGGLAVGAAPQEEIGVASYRVFGPNQVDPDVSCNAAAAGIDEAAHDLRGVINLSAGWHPSVETACQAMVDAVQFATSDGIGSLVVVAAGNSSSACSEFGNIVCFPANLPESFAVSGLRFDFPDGAVFWSGSTSGPEVDISAGGEDITVSCPSGSKLACPGGGVGPRDGTSYSAPQVAAAAALVMAKYPDSYRHQDVVRQHLQDRSYLPENGYDPDKYGAGILDALAAFENDPCATYDCSDPIIF